MFADTQLKRAACSRCGARTELEAERLCRPQQTPSGDYECPGDEHDADAAGYLRQPTAAAWEELGRWCDEEARKMGQVVPQRPVLPAAPQEQERG